MFNMKMKITKFAALLLALVGMTSCYDDFISDYPNPNMGFVLGKQVRTVVSTTNKIYVGVSIGGKREIDMNDWANFTLDETLLASTSYKMLPESYYTMDDPNTFRVRKSNLAVADVGISFTDEFYADPACLSNTYALPFRLLATSIPAEDAPHGAIRKGAETAVVVVKYISGYSGTYYRMGEVVETDASGWTYESEYRNGDLSTNAKVTLTTLGRDVLRCPGLADNPYGALVLSLTQREGSEDCDVAVDVEGDGVVLVDASAEYVKKGDHKLYSSDEDAPQINLEYTYTYNGSEFSVSEVLVLRQYAERELRVETF